ncbi:uncharacterized protein LOC125492747 [Beta vulgaris subsp. vulgaris]|uniref:uncharacterized protein LOC125492747 n=1 Tax=Beta vulgaris subsp. vulgaris TaxID=3555 RepID=UPI002036DCD2|nr:uncharacterized protein LOC125492747 [Beta vulgaris subsp. vulgaris]
MVVKYKNPYHRKKEVGKVGSYPKNFIVDQALLEEVVLYLAKQSDMIMNADQYFEGLKLFSETFRLQANNAKSSLYCSGISDDEANRIQQFSGFSREQLTFRYLGVFSNKKISIADCEGLLEKMSGKVVSAKSGYINWDQVCSPKKMGGLGFKNVAQWNIAAVGKLVWHIGINKDDMWVKCIHSIYINDQNWWSFSAPPSASWIVKQICKVKSALSGLNMQNWQQDKKYTIATVYHTIIH